MDRFALVSREGIVSLQFDISEKTKALKDLSMIREYLFPEGALCSHPIKDVAYKYLICFMLLSSTYIKLTIQAQ